MTEHQVFFDIDTIDRNTGYDISGYISKLSEIKKQYSIFADGLYEVKAEPDTDNL